MTFLQPALLWGLPAIIVPIIIHLLNKLRYRSVQWAAMEFIHKATNTSVNRAKLRHYLVLFCRVMALLMLIIALSRPITGGWLGTTLAGAPDTIIILLDRSASMESTISSLQISKRQHMLDLISEADVGNDISSHYILIENVLLSPQEIAGPSALSDVALASPTDTAASIPAMLRTALDYMIKNKTGQTEIWIASDLQKSNWLPNSPEWQNLTAQMFALPQDVSVRLLAIEDNDIPNVSVSLHEAYRQKEGEESFLRLALNIDRTSVDPEVIPMVMTLDGTRVQTDIAIKGSKMRYNMKQELLSENTLSGWGEVRFPADGNVRDNSCYFVYRKEIHQRGVVVSDNSKVARYLKLATAPSRGTKNRASEILSSGSADTISMNDLSLLLWQSAIPEGEVAEKIENFVRNGGSVIFFPPADAEEALSKDKTAENNLFGLAWERPETAGGGGNWSIVTWDEYGGPLANTENSISLPVAELEFRRRQNIIYEASSSSVSNTVEGEISHVFASYDDGKPFLLRRKTGKGNVFVCTSLPGRNWSNMGSGMVLVPMIQRIMRLGTMALSQTEVIDCGKWRPTDSVGPVTRLDSMEESNYLWNSGVYKSGERTVALNRPASEDIPDIVKKEKVREIFGDVPIQVIERLAQRKTGSVASEMWHIFVFLSLAFLLVESQLLLSNRLFSKQNRKEQAS